MKQSQKNLPNNLQSFSCFIHKRQLKAGYFYGQMGGEHSGIMPSDFSFRGMHGILWLRGKIISNKSLKKGGQK